MENPVRYFSHADMMRLGVSLKAGSLRDAALAAWSDIRDGQAYGLKSVLYPEESELWKQPQFEEYRHNLFGERLGWKLSALSSVGSHYAAVKIVGANALNRRLGQPRSASTILLLDKFTLQLLCLMDGTEISAARTATYVSTTLDLFFQGVENVSVFLFGAGPVAGWIVRMLEHFGKRTVAKIYVRSRSGESARELARSHASSLAVPIKAVTDNMDLRSCQLVITATNAGFPVFETRELQDNAVVLHLAGDETPSGYVQTVLRRGLALCDDLTMVSRRNSQSLALYFSRMSTTLEQMGPLLGVKSIKDYTPSPGRSDRPVLLTCVGLPMLDLYVASYVYDTWLRSPRLH